MSLKKWLYTNNDKDKKEKSYETHLYQPYEHGSESSEMTKNRSDNVNDNLTSTSNMGNDSSCEQDQSLNTGSDFSISGDIESFIQETFPLITSEYDDLLMFGNGSNKVFGYENFGNTCYCNSVLQCLYNLSELRTGLLKYPIRSDLSNRIRKVQMIGNKPRVFTETNFASSHQTVTLPHSGTSVSSITTINKQGSKKYSGVFFKNNVSQKLVKNSQNPSYKSNNQLNQNASQHIQASVGADIINEDASKKHSTIIVGRPPNLNQLEPYFSSPNCRLSSSISPALPLSSVSPTITTNFLSNSGSNSSREERKRQALIRGPILTIDHSLIDYYPSSQKPNLYSALKDAFECIVENRSLVGVVSPVHFVDVLKKDNALFSSMMHQDAHEFLNFLLNELSDSVQRQIDNENLKNRAPPSNFIDKLFKGVMTNRTKCLTCDNITTRDEAFLDFPIEVYNDEEIDIQTCLGDYHQREMMNGSNKFYCDKCCGLQEAERSVGLKHLPKILALHLKRFEYSEKQNCNIKLFNKINYPLYLRICSTFDSSICKSYELNGIVIHMGGDPQHGHYVSICKNDKFGWLLFDDETVESIDEASVLKFYGDTAGLTTAYVLFYKESIGEIPHIEKEFYAQNIEQLIKYVELARVKSDSNDSMTVELSQGKNSLLDPNPNNKVKSKSRLFSFKKSLKSRLG